MEFVGMLAVVRTALEARLVSIQARIASLETAMAAAAGNGISSMELDTGEARQKVVLRNTESIERTLESLYSLEDWLLRRLNGGGIVTINRRRKG